MSELTVKDKSSREVPGAFSEQREQQVPNSRSSRVCLGRGAFFFHLLVLWSGGQEIRGETTYLFFPKSHQKRVVF